MSKNIYIGDIHGRSIWKEIVSEHSDADNIVFIGDYLDSFEVSPVIQLHNLKEIIEFKKFQELDPAKKVYLLIGNHDHHYFPNILHRGSTSGFQATMLHSFMQVFIDYAECFQIALMIGNNICTHAGVSSVFLDELGYWTYDKHIDESHIADFLNELFVYKPNSFSFDSYLDRQNTGRIADGYGDDIWQTPIWIRPKSLQRSNKNTDLKKNYVQIVGHTAKEKIDIKGKSTGGKYYYIDTLGSGQYLIEEQGEFRIGYVNLDK